MGVNSDSHSFVLIWLVLYGLELKDFIVILVVRATTDLVLVQIGGLAAGLAHLN